MTDPKPDPDLLNRWAQGLPLNPNPTGYDQWTKREWRAIEVANIRAAGQRQAADLHRSMPLRPRLRVCWAGVAAWLSCTALAVFAALAATGIIR